MTKEELFQEFENCYAAQIDDELFFPHVDDDQEGDLSVWIGDVLPGESRLYIGDVARVEVVGFEVLVWVVGGLNPYGIIFLYAKEFAAK